MAASEAGRISPIQTVEQKQMMKARRGVEAISTPRLDPARFYGGENAYEN